MSVHGAPGSGRSTQCAAIVALLKGTYLNAIEAMNAAVSIGTPVGEKVTDVLNQGKAVTHELYAELLKEAMGGSSGPFVIDGWPEDGPGVEALTEAGIKVSIAIALDVPEAVRATRISERSGGQRLGFLQRRGARCLRCGSRQALQGVRYAVEHAQLCARLRRCASSC